jgi:hypothetical protein
MIVLSTLQYEEEAYGSASCAVLRQLDAVHHKGIRLALLCKAGFAKLDEIRKLNNTKTVSQIVTSADHLTRPYFMNLNKLDEYAMRPRDPQPLFVRTPEYLGET